MLTRTAATWTEQAKLLASEGVDFDRLGVSVAVWGNTAVVGAYKDDESGTDSGSAYVFVRNGATWTQQAKLTPSDGAANAFFGSSVAVWGDTAVVGAPYDDDSGSAYVFTQTGTTWTQQAKLLASDGSTFDYFGFSVAVSGDTALVGAHGSDDSGNDSGSAYVFVRTAATWTEQAKLIPGDGAASDFFGVSVALSGDTAVVGAYEDDDSGSDSGSAYVFVLLQCVTDADCGADPCHLAGTCDASTGICDNPTVADGTLCDDGDACTLVDTCHDGVCTGDDIALCTASDACHVAGTCDPSTGACDNPTEADGTACDGGTCQNGVCQPDDTTGAGGAGAGGGSSMAGGDTSGAGGDTSGVGGEADRNDPIEISDCGCRMPGRPGPAGAHGAFALALAGLVARRRKPRATR